MAHPLELKILQMHKALESSFAQGLDCIETTITRSPNGEVMQWETKFGGSADEAEIANEVTLLLASIGTLKDHLRKWCEVHNPAKKDAAKDLLKSNQACAVIQDLWNKDKHMELDNPPWSGLKPTLKNARPLLGVGSGPGGPSARRIIYGEVEDENGTQVGLFHKLLEDAIDGWNVCLKSCGVPI